METENENLSSNAHVFHTTIPTGDFASSIGRELLLNYCILFFFFLSLLNMQICDVLVPFVGVVAQAPN